MLIELKMRRIRNRLKYFLVSIHNIRKVWSRSRKKVKIMLKCDLILHHHELKLIANSYANSSKFIDELRHANKCNNGKRRLKFYLFVLCGVTQRNEQARIYKAVTWKWYLKYYKIISKYEINFELYMCQWSIMRMRQK